MQNFKRLLIVKSLLFIAGYNLIPSLNYVEAQELNRSSSLNQIDNEYSDNNNYDLQKNVYILGPGDELSLEIIGTDIEVSNYQVLNDGSISVPLAGDFNLIGKTISQTKKEIIERLKEQILEPEISLRLIKSRPISVFVLGEINDPGLYNFSSKNDEIKNLPTLVSAIKNAGGITQDTNLKEVELLRLLPGNKNEYKSTVIDLVDLIFDGKNQNNPYLFDGDIIKLKKTNKKFSEKINTISTSNLTPRLIEISIIGEVKTPGTFTVDKKTSLFQSILKAGGPINGRSSTSNVDLFRINRDGSATHKKFKLDFKKGMSPENPLLKQGDVVRVRRNLITKSSDSLATISNPLQGLVTIYSLFKIID